MNIDDIIHFDVVVKFVSESKVGKLTHEFCSLLELEPTNWKLGGLSSTKVCLDKCMLIIFAVIRKEGRPLDCDVHYDELRTSLETIASNYGTQKICVINDDHEYNDWFAIKGPLDQTLPHASIITL